MIQSPVFWIVLAASALIFWRLPERFRFTFLSLVSYGYLAWLEPVGATVLIGWVLLFFFVAPHAMAKEKRGHLILTGLVLVILSYLAWHKYLPVLWDLYQGASVGVTIAAPLGISYFTFKLIHYAIETARGNITDRSLPRFFCYIFLFPIFTAGPIQRFDRFIANTETTWNRETTIEGITRIIHGLIKVFVIAQLLNPAHLGNGVPVDANQLIARFDDLAFWQIWAFLAVTYLFAYMDFSAYSDIAIGASRLFGFRIMENFNWPILAVNIQDFWKRWHMTLAAWCQSYVYMPVMARTRTPYAAVFATFVAMGIWHGAAPGWVMWGLYHASGLALYMTWARYWRKSPKWRELIKSKARYLGLPLTFAFVTGSYAFSSMDGSFGTSIMVFLALFGIRIG